MEGKKHFETAFRLHSDEVRELTDTGLYVYNVTQEGYVEPFVAEGFDKTIVTNFPIKMADEVRFEDVIEAEGSQKVDSLDKLSE